MSIYEELKKIIDSDSLKTAVVPRPSDQLSGHAGGLPFEKLVHDQLTQEFPGRAFRHYEALNHALTAAQGAVGEGFKAEDHVFGSPAVDFLSRRGEDALKKWSLENLFEEKQNDTAESIVFSDATKNFSSPLVSLVDVKSQNAVKKAQPPNIISANKLIEAAKLVLPNGNPVDFEILYVGVKFKAEERDGKAVLVATDWTVVDLFKIDPAKIYINWSAAFQIQFHPFGVDQSYDGTPNEWLKHFVRVYVTSLEKRVEKQQKAIDELKKLIAE